MGWKSVIKLTFSAPRDVWLRALIANDIAAPFGNDRWVFQKCSLPGTESQTREILDIEARSPSSNMFRTLLDITIFCRSLLSISLSFPAFGGPKIGLSKPENVRSTFFSLLGDFEERGEEKEEKQFSTLKGIETLRGLLFRPVTNQTLFSVKTMPCGQYQQPITHALSFFAKMFLRRASLRNWCISLMYDRLTCYSYNQRRGKAMINIPQHFFEFRQMSERCKATIKATKTFSHP